jgi:hypothetical protein
LEWGGSGWRPPARRQSGGRHEGCRWSGNWRQAGRKASGGDASAQAGVGMTRRVDGNDIEGGRAARSDSAEGDGGTEGGGSGSGSVSMSVKTVQSEATNVERAEKRLGL